MCVIDINPQGNGKLRYAEKPPRRFFPVRCGSARASGSNPIVEVGVYHNIPPSVPLATNRSLCAYS